MQEGILVMSQEELQRFALIRKVVGKELCQREAAKLLGLSERQVRRLVKRFKAKGERGLIHQKRGQSNCRKFGEHFKTRVLNLYERRYKGFGALLASEKMAARDRIKINRETLRQWLLDENYLTRRRTKKRHRVWRERKGFYGEMVQMDGSHHDWLEGRGPRMVLMGYIDDATNRTYGRFYDYEGTIPALDSFKRYVLKYGIPTSVYLDRHSTYKTTHYDEWKAKIYGQEPPLSQFERSLKELGVKVIHANSAPAKGRIERFFRTVQDRLVKELRLANARTQEQANEVLKSYLIEHNARYTIEPVKVVNLHRRSPSAYELNGILCVKKEHPLRNDFTIVHEGKLYQILEYTNVKQVEAWDQFVERQQALDKLMVN
jgi:transposase